MPAAVTVSVPASSANLGPGFDSFAVALGLRLELEVVETGRFAVVTELDVATDRSNLVVRAFEQILSADRYEFRVSSEIPLSGGLGSSAAAVVAGLTAADAIVAGSNDLLALATEIEGHPDNVAAALKGGFVICADDFVNRVVVFDRLAAVVVVPHDAVRTRDARAVLPAAVPLQDAAFNAARASLLTLGITGGDPELLSQGLHDRLHQPYREKLYPRSMELVRASVELGALGAAISGAGPTVLVWCGVETADEVASAVASWAGDWAQVLRVPFEPAGASAR